VLAWGPHMTASDTIWASTRAWTAGEGDHDFFGLLCGRPRDWQSGRPRRVKSCSLFKVRDDDDPPEDTTSNLSASRTPCKGIEPIRCQPGEASGILRMQFPPIGGKRGNGPAALPANLKLVLGRERAGAGANLRNGA